MTNESVMQNDSLFQVMPPLSDDEFSELKSDIQARGVIIPIEYDETGAVLDVAGWNSDKSKFLTLSPGLVKGWWKISFIDVSEQCEFVSDKEIATSRLPFYIPIHQFSLNPVHRCLKTVIGNHCVYFIYAESAKLVKIGTTNGNAEGRLRQIETMSPVPLHIIGSIPGDHKVEKELHQRFAKYRRHGEWFAVDGELKEYISKQFLGAQK